MKELINTLAQIFESHFIEENMNEEYPASFNKEEFKSLTSFRERIKYCEKHLKRINSGSSRIVYQIDNEKVLKLAKNKKGIAQNEVEYDYGTGNYFDVFAEIFDADDKNFLWIEMELAKKVTPQLFQSIVGVSFEEYGDILMHYDSAVNPRRYANRTVREPENMQQYWEDGFIKDMFDYMGNTNTPIGDLIRLSSYGIVGNDEIVLVDYGLDDTVASDYYS